MSNTESAGWGGIRDKADLASSGHSAAAGCTMHILTPFSFLCHLWKTKRDKGIIRRTPHCSEEDFSRGKKPVNSEPFVSKKQIT